MSKTMKNIDSFTHVRGESIFVDDLITRQDTLIGLVFDSPKAHGKIKEVNYSKAEKVKGVVKIFTYKDILGVNQIGEILPDEPLWAENEVHYWGQPIAFIVAESEAIAKKARLLIEIEIEELPVITTAIKAKEKKSFISAPIYFKLGDTAATFSNCDHVTEGETFSNGQEHLYLETQGCYAVPQENGSIKITSSTQGPAQVQKAAARVLGVAMHKIEVDVIRLGGGFGGKEDQATAWAVMAAVAVQYLNKPIKYILNRYDDLRMTGKRHPYSSFFKIGLNKDLKIMAFEAEFLQNSGAAADLSPAIAERTLFHATNSYFIPNVSTVVYSCKTNLPPNTAFRGFGGPQGMFVIESAIAKMAEEMGIDKRKIQEANLLAENDEFSYGQIATKVEAQSTWFSAKEKFEFGKLEKEIFSFNRKNAHFKKGISLMPITFGISFTNTMMNHARALVHIYQDGSVGVSTGAVEMGQGVNTKMLQVAQITLGISANKVKLETTNTTRVANTSPSAASVTADLNGKAVDMACVALIERLRKVAAKMASVDESTIFFKEDYVFVNGEKSEFTWETIVAQAMVERIVLSENAHYATPIVHFDKIKGKGHPFAYHVYGTAITAVTLDCVRGTYEIDFVKIVHDFGKSMNIGIDIGQVEGALVQGIGWMTTEEIAYSSDGRLLSNALSTYKVPDIFSAPKTVEIIPAAVEGNKMAIRKSKAVGEPPLMYGIGAYFAIQQAVKAFNKNYKLKFDSPFTPGKVLTGLYEKN
ncbi:molybdopterin cofactor-binding domain-containing protein [Labilibaculum sp.]|uniref:molybdopterin cofactor-binding domain-containing protein n=1 Tax=Labilibaculum sp. TaxID=2060723 RepID=UPI0035685288